jgi:hypothetical protein
VFSAVLVAAPVEVGEVGEETKLEPTADAALLDGACLPRTDSGDEYCGGWADGLDDDDGGVDECD